MADTFLDWQLPMLRKRLYGPRVGYATGSRWLVASFIVSTVSALRKDTYKRMNIKENSLTPLLLDSWGRDRNRESSNMLGLMLCQYYSIRNCRAGGFWRTWFWSWSTVPVRVITVPGSFRNSGRLASGLCQAKGRPEPASLALTARTTNCPTPPPLENICIYVQCSSPCPLYLGSRWIIQRHSHFRRAETLNIATDRRMSPAGAGDPARDIFEYERGAMHYSASNPLGV